MTVKIVATAVFLATSLQSIGAGAEDSGTWAQEKCRVYEQAWASALEFFGSDNINYNFLAGNENFIASDCSEGGYICPQSDQELEIANALTIALMNIGAASTFLPFSCAPNS